jgi:hypothetical protein
MGGMERAARRSTGMRIGDRAATGFAMGSPVCGPSMRYGGSRWPNFTASGGLAGRMPGEFGRTRNPEGGPFYRCLKEELPLN